MSLIIIVGPQAVGKMTVGQELAKLTELRLFHNHMTIDLVGQFFPYRSDTGRELVARFRQEIFEAVAASDLPGLIFTFVWLFDQPTNHAYIQKIKRIFETAGKPVYIVELEAELATRIARNASPNRLEHKPSKRDVEFFGAELRRTAEKHRLNSHPGEIQDENYLRVDNTDLPASAVARQIKERFGL